MAFRQTRDRVARIFFQRCFYLFVALIIFLVASPFILELPQSRLWLAATQAFVLVAAVAAVSRSVPAFVLSAFLAAIALWFSFGTDPGAFAFGGAAAVLTRFDFVYFSFTTMTSTGFGDFTPARPVSRMVVASQQIFGVLFVAMLIARLAGVYPPMQR